MNFHHTPVPSDHVSRVDAPCLFHGTVGVCIGVLMQLIGLFQHADDRLVSFLLNPVFQGEMPESLSVWLLAVVAAVFSYALAFAVLDSHGSLRRVMLGVTVLILVLAIQPTLAVWNIYFSPFLPIVSVFWAWFFSVMYANHHVMPCDLAHLPQSSAPNHLGHQESVTPIVVKEMPEKKVAKVKVEASVNDPNAKYKPQNLTKEKADG